MTTLEVDTLPRLSECETIIERGLSTFVEVGNALLEIRDSRLYRESHATFEDYCKGRWGMARANAYRLIEAAKAVADLSPIGDIPKTESQARELAAIEPPLRASVWERALETAPEGKVTAAHVRETAREFVQPQQTANRLAPLMSSASDEWYTPSHVVELARVVLGKIDLDPATSPLANETVKASRTFTRDDDGLAHEWRGRVFMNPPYGDVIGQWTQKLVAEYEAGRVTSAIALLPGRIDTAWFQPLFNYAICAIRGRLKFSNADAATFPSVVVYFGDDLDGFISTFSALGVILVRATGS